MEASTTETRLQNASNSPSATPMQAASPATPAPPKSFANGIPPSVPEAKPEEKNMTTPTDKIPPANLKKSEPSTSTQSKPLKQSPKHTPVKQSPAKQPIEKQSSAKQTSAKQSGPGQASSQTNSNGQAAINNDQDVAKMKRNLCKVQVSGYPTFAKAQDLQKLFSQYGNTKVEMVNRKFAVIVFPTPEEAKAAVNDSMNLCLYGQFLTIKPYSGNETYRKKNKNNNSPVSEVVPPPEQLSFSGSFEEQLGGVLAAVRLTQEEVLALATLYGDVERVLQPLWPGCQAMPFGSLTTGLGVKSSDADCFVNIPPQYRHAQFSFVGRARRALQQFPHLFADVIAIPRANTPIVKLLHVPTRTRCDLSFKTPLGALNSKLVAFLLHADPRFLPLAVLLKYWAGAHRLSGTGRLTNYALTLLLVFYLQQRGLLPAVHTLQRDPAHSVLVDGWDSGFAPDRALLAPADPADHPEPEGVDALLGGFFAFYHAFDWDALVVCPYLGRPLRKEQFERGEPPEELARYRRNVEEGHAAPLRVRVPLCVQDPFEQSHNVASAVTARLAGDLRAYLAFAADAYAAERPAGCPRLLRTLLLERPRIVRVRSHPEYRAHVPPRALAALAADWRAAVRVAVELVFARVLLMPLTPQGAPERTRNRRERERYEARFHLPLWRRERYARAGASDAGFVERQARVTEEMAAAEARMEAVSVEVSVSYGVRGRSAWAAVRLDDGDPDVFHRFGRWYTATMGRLLLGALTADGAAPLDAAAAAADADGGDDDSDDDEGDGDDDAADDAGDPPAADAAAGERAGGGSGDERSGGEGEGCEA